MEPIPFPKMIYKGGDQTGEWAIAADEKDMERLALEGFIPAGEIHEEAPKRKAGRPRKED